MCRARFLGYFAQFIDWYKHHHFGVQRFSTLSYVEVPFSSSCSSTTHLCLMWSLCLSLPHLLGHEFWQYLWIVLFKGYVLSTSAMLTPRVSQCA